MMARLTLRWQRRLFLRHHRLDTPARFTTKGGWTGQPYANLVVSLELQRRFRNRVLQVRRLIP